LPGGLHGRGRRLRADPLSACPPLTSPGPAPPLTSPRRAPPLRRARRCAGPPFR
jgi:hypothetical protein